MRAKTPLLVVTTTAIAAATTTSLASFNNLILISAATAFQFQSSASKSIAMTPMATTIIRPAVAHESCSILLGATVFRTTSCINNRSNTKLNQYHRGNMHMHMHGQQQQQQQQQRRCNYSTTTTSLFSSPKFSLFGSVKDGYYDNINNDEIGLDKLLQKAASVRSKWTTKTTATTATTAHSSSPSSSWSSSSLSALINTIGGNDDYCKSNLFFSSSYDASEKTAEFDNSDNNQNQNKSIRGFSNWIIPGKIMVGQYPGRVPEQTTPTIEDTRKHIRNVLFANDIDNNQNNYNNNNNNTTICFVSLQSELPPQDDKETWNKNNGEIYLNDDPESMNRKQWPNPFSHYLSEIELVIKQNNDYDDETDETEDEAITTTITKQLPPSQVQYIHHPIEDLSVPSNSKNLRLLLWKILNVLDSNHENMVYIHCWGGRGRAGLTACCLLTLLSFANNTDTDTDTDDTVNVEMIFDIVQEGYDSRLGSCDMPIGLQRSPQTESQRTFVRKFFEQVVVQQQASQLDS